MAQKVQQCAGTEQESKELKNNKKVKMARREMTVDTFHLLTSTKWK
jgi:hypothetical protein